MPVFQLPRQPVFPDPEFAEPGGLLAVGGDLSVQRLVAAYQQGIFPWYSDGEPLLWWSPSPRLVLFPDEFHLPRRLARTLRQGRFSLTADRDFAAVIELCGEIRRQAGEGTWITPEMKTAYIRLHELGFAHSIETRRQGGLVGGLYGVCLDRVFFGESMFSLETDSSKAALAALVDQFRSLGIRMIDCQMTTAHLMRFGAREIERDEFTTLLGRWIRDPNPQKKWRLEDLDKEGIKITGACQEGEERY